MDATEFFLLIAVGTAMVLLLDLISGLIRPAYLSEPMIAMTVGIVLGPTLGLGLLDLRKIGDPKIILEYAAQITLAIGLMGAALRLTPMYTVKFRRTLPWLLLVGMPLMWISASSVALLVFGLPVTVALLVGAVITPTDPVVSTTIVTGRVAETCLTYRLRHTISAESGFNDGLAYPLVALAILLLGAQAGGELMWDWLRVALIGKTLGGILIGAMFGYGAAKLLHLAERHEDIEIESILSYTLALSLVTFSIAELASANGMVSVFFAGVFFGAKAGARERLQQENVQEAVNRFFTLPIFLLIGLAVPWDEWLDMGYPAFVFAGAIVLFRRLPVWIALAAVTPGLRRREMLFSGWFGPVGIAALYYALHAEKETGNAVVWPLTVLVICASVFAHGITAAPFSRVLKRSFQQDRTR